MHPVDCRNSVGYYLQQFASLCATPICSASEAFHKLISPLPDETSKKEEFFSRVFYALYACGACVVGVPTGALHLTARLVHHAVMDQPFVHLRGESDFLPVEMDTYTIMSWNVCVIAGGFAKSTGGMEHWSERIDGIQATIESKNPDILCLYEVQDTDFFNALFQSLKGRFAECYTFLGAHPYKAVSGIVVFSRVRSSFEFNSFDSATGSASWENKGFAHMVIGEKVQCVFTHLQHGPASSKAVADVRNDQLRQIIRTVDRMDVPAILCGDMNVDATGVEFGSSLLNSAFLHGDLETSTWTSFFIRKVWKGQRDPELFEKKLDYVCMRDQRDVEKRVQVKEETVRAYSTSVPVWSVSDHHAKLASVRIID